MSDFHEARPAGTVAESPCGPTRKITNCLLRQPGGGSSSQAQKPKEAAEAKFWPQVS